VSRFLVPLLLLMSCQAPGKTEFEGWDDEFVHRPPEFDSAVTALWISGYQEDANHRFVRYSAYGSVPDKLVGDGSGSYAAAISLHRQAETSDGPVPDQFVDYLVRVAREPPEGDSFRFLPIDPLPEPVAVWTDVWNRTVHARGYLETTDNGTSRVLWEFRGRY